MGAKQIIADLHLLREQCSELGELRDEIARAKSESETIETNLAQLRKDLLDMRRQHGEAMHKFRSEQKELTQQSQDKQRELNGVVVELAKHRAEIAAIRQRLGAQP